MATGMQTVDPLNCLGHNNQNIYEFNRDTNLEYSCSATDGLWLHFAVVFQVNRHSWVWGTRYYCLFLENLLLVQSHYVTPVLVYEPLAHQT